MPEEEDAPKSDAPKSEDAPKSKSESNPPPGTTKSFVLKVKSAATLITAVAALVIAVGKACQAPEEPGAKAAYSELSAAVKANSEALGRTHDDVVALRGYVDGFIKAESLTPTPAPTLTPSIPGIQDAGTRLGHTTVIPPAPSTSASASSAPAFSGVFASMAPTDRPKLPPVTDRPPVFQPQGFGKPAKKDSHASDF